MDDLNTQDGFEFWSEEKQRVRVEIHVGGEEVPDEEKVSVIENPDGLVIGSFSMREGGDPREGGPFTAQGEAYGTVPAIVAATCIVLDGLENQGLLEELAAALAANKPAAAQLLQLLLARATIEEAERDTRPNGSGPEGGHRA